MTNSVVYKDLPDYPGYRVGDDGTVWSRRTYQGTIGQNWHVLRPRKDKDGYLSVTLFRDNKRHTRKVSHLVLESFVGPCPVGCESCHYPDPDVTNNRIGNLRWDTHRNNIQDKMTDGTTAKGERHGMSKLTAVIVREIRRLHTEGLSYGVLSTEYGVSKHQIYLIVKRKNWAHV